MCSNAFVEIDGKKLKALLRDQNVALTAASRELGYSDSYLNSAVSRCLIRRSVTDLLDSYYGIKLDSYIRKEPVAEEANSEKQQSVEIPEEFWTQLHHCIYSAVYEAVKKAWSE